jgi:hypothetical protein
LRIPVVFCLLSLPLSVCPRPMQPHGPAHRDFTLPPDLTRPPVQYYIDASVVPESLGVSARVDMSWRNRTSHPESQVWLQLPESDTTSCRFDSILFRGVRLRPWEQSREASLLRLRLTSPLPPGETGQLSVWYEARLEAEGRQMPWGDDTLLDFHDWCPRLRLGTATSPIALARFNFRLAVDSSWHAIPAGGLLNEKELYGWLPNTARDSGVHLGLRSDSLVLYGRTYEPVFENGMKRYQVQLSNATDCGFALVRIFRRDRVIVGRTRLDLFASESTVPSCSDSLAGLVYGVCRALRGVPGLTQKRVLTMLVASEPGEIESSSLPVVACNVFDNDRDRAVFAGWIVVSSLDPERARTGSVVRVIRLGEDLKRAADVLSPVLGIDSARLFELWWDMHVESVLSGVI